MFKDEITLDDVIEFIIKNCDDRKAMDKISKTSFPFTTKYLEKQESRSTVTIDRYSPYKPYLEWTMTFVSDNETRAILSS